MQSSWTAGHAALTCVPPGIDRTMHAHHFVDGTDMALKIAAEGTGSTLAKQNLQASDSGNGKRV